MIDRVPPMRSYTVAYRDDSLRNREQGADGKWRTLWLTHPNGNRKVRRYRQRHHPFFTKSHHKGRDWYQAMRQRGET